MEIGRVYSSIKKPIPEKIEIIQLHCLCFLFSTKEIINWSSEILSGGTIGDVFLIKGTCIKNTMKKLNSKTSNCI